MAEMTMTEKDHYVAGWEREFQTTLKVVKAYPADKLDLKPHPTCRSAAELIWTLVGGEVVIEQIIKGQIEFKAPPPPPGTLQELLGAFEATHKQMAEKLKGVSEADFNKPIPFPVGPGKMGDLRRGDIFWMVMMDSIHHRGQFSVYLRMAGGKVPSIYGPSGDEPWM